VQTLFCGKRVFYIKFVSCCLTNKISDFLLIRLRNNGVENARKHGLDI
jgi:hypothetical protein